MVFEYVAQKHEYFAKYGPFVLGVGDAEEIEDHLLRYSWF